MFVLFNDGSVVEYDLRAAGLMYLPNSDMCMSDVVDGRRYYPCFDEMNGSVRTFVRNQGWVRTAQGDIDSRGRIFLNDTLNLDALLISLASRGNEQWVAGFLFKRIHGYLTRAARTRIRFNESVHDEIVSRAYDKFIRNLVRIKSCSLETCAYRCLISVWIDYLRSYRYRNTAYIEDLEGLHPVSSGATDSSSDQRTTTQFVQDRMQRISEKYRTILLLRYTKEMSYEEIAQHLNIPIGTVMSRLFHAHRALRRAIEESVSKRTLDLLMPS